MVLESLTDRKDEMTKQKAKGTKNGTLNPRGSMNMKANIVKAKPQPSKIPRPPGGGGGEGGCPPSSMSV